MTTNKIKRTNVTDLQQIISSDIDDIGIFTIDNLEVIVNDLLGFDDGVLSGLLPTEDDVNIYITGDGRLIQSGNIGTSDTWSQQIIKPSAGARTDVVCCQIIEIDSVEEQRLFLISPDSDTQETLDTYTVIYQGITFQVIEGSTSTPATAPTVPSGWIKLSEIVVTTSTLTVTDDRDMSNAASILVFNTDPEAWLIAHDFLKGVECKQNNSLITSNATGINLIQGTNITVTATETPAGQVNYTIASAGAGSVGVIYDNYQENIFLEITNTNEISLVSNSNNQPKVGINSIVYAISSTLTLDTTGYTAGNFYDIYAYYTGAVVELFALISSTTPYNTTPPSAQHTRIGCIYYDTHPESAVDSVIAVDSWTNATTNMFFDYKDNFQMDGGWQQVRYYKIPVFRSSNVSYVNKNDFRSLPGYNYSLQVCLFTGWTPPPVGGPYPNALGIFGQLATGTTPTGVSHLIGPTHMYGELLQPGVYNRYYGVNYLNGNTPNYLDYNMIIDIKPV